MHNDIFMRESVALPNKIQQKRKYKQCQINEISYKDHGKNTNFVKEIMGNLKFTLKDHRFGLGEGSTDYVKGSRKKHDLHQKMVKKYILHHKMVNKMQFMSKVCRENAIYIKNL